MGSPMELSEQLILLHLVKMIKQRPYLNCTKIACPKMTTGLPASCRNGNTSHSSPHSLLVPRYASRRRYFSILVLRHHQQ